MSGIFADPMKAFWLILVVITLIWYTFVTLYVAIRGVSDIKQMLANLKGDAEAEKTSLD